MNRRKFQVFANKALYDCVDMRDDEKDLMGQVVTHGVDRFPVIAEDQLVCFPIIDIDLFGKPEAKNYQYLCDTSSLG